MSKTSGSKGLLASIQEKGKQLETQEEPLKNQITIEEKQELKNENSEELKNKNSKESKNSSSEELSIKRSYTLRPSTVKKLEELKVFVYTDPKIKFNDIVDEAINLLYEKKKELRNENS